ncbi:MAG: dihydropteroate synthase [Balneolaceae bacterium]
MGLLTVRDRQLDLSVPVVMGILNVTPDSFSDGGRYPTIEEALKRIVEMEREGAAIIDIGGESTRPGSDPVSAEEEYRRVIPVLKEAVASCPDLLFSVDTTKPEVAEAALNAGAHIINDVSAMRSGTVLPELCKKYEAGYVLMHSQGEPRTMQEDPRYEDPVKEILHFFRQKLKELNRCGVSRVILDPGIGFGKLSEHNLKLLAGLDQFSGLGFPLLIGASRKSFIGGLLDGRPADERLAGTLAVHYDSLVRGASILRVHDVREAADTIRVFQAIRNVERKES